jgi:oligosaccharide 4-alpha-D-glucosyltransferase
MCQRISRRFVFCLVFFSSFFQRGVAQSSVGDYSSYTFDGRVLAVWAGTSAVRIVPYASNVIRIDYLPDSTATFDSTYVVVQDTSLPVAVTLSTTDSTIVFSTADVKIVCSKNPVRLAFFSSQGSSLLSEAPSGGFSASGSIRTETFLLNPHDHFYGTGERSSKLDLRGTKFASYNTQIGGYSTPLPTMNIERIRTLL